MTSPDLNTSKTIMVVDDDESIVSFLSFSLKSEGFTVLESRDGQRALNMLKTQVPDLILMDIMMPKIDGITLCRTLRADPRFDKIPILFITASADTQILKKVAEVGAQGLMEKPIMFSELLVQVLDALDGKFSLPTRLKFAS